MLINFISVTYVMDFQNKWIFLKIKLRIEQEAIGHENQRCRTLFNYFYI